jgi:uncharacterized cupredoxin-like copper-binding protein
VKFQTEHLATLAKYAGISFVAGAVNHGFFSERRSFVTAGIGVVFFLIGAAMELKSAPDGAKRWADLLGFGILASIGLGFFTGGLQHFPDSPERSLWVVPVGFFMSLGALYFGEGRSRISARPLTVYTAATGISVIVGSVIAASYWGQQEWGQQEWGQQEWGQQEWGQQDLVHDHSDHGGTAAARTPIDTAAARTPIDTATARTPIDTVAPSADPDIRNVVIELDDSRRIEPANWQARQGEALRLIVVNTGQATHELAVGPARDIAAHADSMIDSGSGKHDHGNAVAIKAVSVEPGKTATLLYTFDEPGEWAMACFEPGHYEGGMKGTVEVEPKL